MVNRSNADKAAVLGMPAGTAGHRLRKNILYKYVRAAGDHFCYKCGFEITSVEDFSIEHKKPWQSTNHPELFWDLDNIAFSHLQCNVRRNAAGREYRECKHCNKTEDAVRFPKSGLVCSACSARLKREKTKQDREAEGKTYTPLRQREIRNNTLECKTCGMWKHLDDFHKNPHTKIGRQSVCKKCANRRFQDYSREKG